LTTVVAVPPGLVLTKQVYIEVTFKSSVNGSIRRTDIYNPTTGTRILFIDGEGTRIARQLPIEIELKELGPADERKQFRWNWSVILDPLFDVRVRPLDFFLRANCDLIGKSEIRFQWNFPPDPAGHSKSFSIRRGETVRINEFAWFGQEIRLKANLRWPTWGFYEYDPFDTTSTVDPLPGQEDTRALLLPDAHSGTISRRIKDNRGDHCTADTSFYLWINVRQYPNL
jgi:hypothetical protein